MKPLVTVSVLLFVWAVSTSAPAGAEPAAPTRGLEL